MCIILEKTKISLHVFFSITIWMVNIGIAKIPSIISPATLSLSPSREKLAFVTMEENDSELTEIIQIVDVNGADLRQIPVVSGLVDGQLTWSSDNENIAFTIVDNENKTIHIHVAEIKSLKVQEVTTSKSNKDFSPKWLTNSDKIACVRIGSSDTSHNDNQSNKLSTSSNLWMIDINSHQDEQLTTTNDVYPLSWDIVQGRKKGVYLIKKGDITEVWSVDIQTKEEEKIYSLKGWEKGARFISCSPNGRNLLLFWQSSDVVKGDLWLLNADGSDKKKLSSKRCALMPTWITDSRILTVDKKGNMWELDIEGNKYKRLGWEITNRQPVWDTKTNRVFFVKESKKIWAMDGDGSNPKQIYPAILP